MYPIIQEIINKSLVLLKQYGDNNHQFLSIPNVGSIAKFYAKTPLVIKDTANRVSLEIDTEFGLNGRYPDIAVVNHIAGFLETIEAELKARRNQLESAGISGYFSPEPSI